MKQLGLVGLIWSEINAKQNSIEIKSCDFKAPVSPMNPKLFDRFQGPRGLAINTSSAFLELSVDLLVLLAFCF